MFQPVFTYINVFQIMLPENVKREDNKMYEEVSIEPSSAPPTDIGANRIKVADLDEVQDISRFETS